MSRKQLLAVAVGAAVAVAIIVGAVVGTQNSSASAPLTSGPQPSAELCSGEPCTADTNSCRSKYGFCGVGSEWCNDQSTWRATGCIARVPVGGANCTGQPCADKSLCRSEYGFCGTGAQYCNAESVWNPDGCLPPSTLAPTSAGSTPATTPPTAPPVPQSSLCTGQVCAAGECRSEWGYCGTSPAYCNAKSTFTPACPGGGTSSPVSSAPTGTKTPTLQPTTSGPTLAGVTKSPSSLQPTAQPTAGTRTPTAPTVTQPAGSILSIIQARRAEISSTLLQYQTPTNAFEPSRVYKVADLEQGVRTALNGIAGMTFIGDGIKGKLNLAAFLAQSMKETIKYDVCDENNWDLVGGMYPASNSCGQLGQKYSDYKCGAAERHMECPIDPLMEKKAATNAKWYGAPAPLFCAPKTKIALSPAWNYGLECNQPWAVPPKTCTEYEGQKAGGFDFSKPYPNLAGRTDVEGCCWWGRGVIQLTGPCNVGKLNYFLGQGAKDRGVLDAPFPDVDFCKEPDAVCASEKYPELKWVSGFFYWMRDVQAGDFPNWNYQSELAKLAEDPNNVNLRRTFINAVSGIVNRGGPFAPGVDGGPERADNFEKAWAILGPTVLAVEDVPAAATESQNTSGMIAGGVVAGLAFVGLAGVFVLVQRRRRSAMQEESTPPRFDVSAANPTFAQV